MRSWRFWWQTVVLSSQANPPRFVELVMLSLAGIVLVFWLFDERWPYLVLSTSYVLGSAASIWVREWISPYRHERKARLFQATTVLGLTSILVLLSFRYLAL